MAYKMKGFPLRSGFKHTEGPHEDHHTGEEEVVKDTTGDSGDEYSKEGEIMAANRYLSSIRKLYHDEGSKHYKSGSMGRNIQKAKDTLAKLGGEDTSIADYQ